MLEFKQLESGEPPDIEVASDDAGAEMLAITELFEQHEIDSEFLAKRNLDEATRGEDGKFRFVIPGDEAGEIAEVWNSLAEQLDTWNAAAMDRAEKAAAGAEE